MLVRNFSAFGRAVFPGSDMLDQGDKLCGVTAAVFDCGLGCLVGATTQPRQDGVAGMFQSGSPRKRLWVRVV